MHMHRAKHTQGCGQFVRQQQQQEEKVLALQMTCVLCALAVQCASCVLANRGHGNVG